MDDDFGNEWLLFNRIDGVDTSKLTFDSYLSDECGHKTMTLWRGKGEFFARPVDGPHQQTHFKAVRQEPKGA